MTKEKLAELEGKVIAAATLESMSEGEDFDVLVLKFHDETCFLLRSYDSDGYQSWMDYKFKGRGET